MLQLFSISSGITRVSALLLLACLSVVGMAQEQQPAGSVKPPLRISVSMIPPVMTPEGDGYLDLILQTLFGKSGTEFRLIPTPAPRGVEDANSGLLDAVLLPFPELEGSFPNLVLMSEPLLSTNISGLYTRDDISISSVEDFFNYRLAYLHGWAATEELFKDHDRVTKVRNPSSLMQVLASNRVDVVFFPTTPGRYIANQIGLKNLKVSDFHIARQLYLHFNIRHAELVPVLEKELLKMKSDGTMESILVGYDSEG